MRAHDSVVATKGVFGRFEEAIGQIGGGAIGIACLLGRG